MFCWVKNIPEEEEPVAGSQNLRNEMVEFRILRRGSREISRITTLDFRRANFGLFKDLLGRIPWTRALEGGGSKRAGRYLSITSSMLRRDASP